MLVRHQPPSPAAHFPVPSFTGQPTRRLAIVGADPYAECTVQKDDLSIQPGLTLPAEELSEQVSTSGGPGGQHANKSNTRVTLRFNVRLSSALTEAQRQRLLTRLSSRLTRTGELVLHSNNHRSQYMNRQDVRERLVQVLREALHIARPRKKTRPSRASNKRRLDSKKKHSRNKQNRKKVRQDSD